MDLERFSIFHQVPAFSSLVGGLRYVLTRDRMTTLFSDSSSVALLDVFLVISYMRTHVVDTSQHQAIDCSRRHHTLQFTRMSHRSCFVVLWKTLRKWCPVFHLFAPTQFHSECCCVRDASCQHVYIYIYIFVYVHVYVCFLYLCVYNVHVCVCVYKVYVCMYMYVMVNEA